MKKLTIMSIALVIIAATLELLDVGLQLSAIGQTQTPQPQTPQPIPTP
ncbi:MAG: pentapeptide repeat-containing protein, partial [Microcoleus sp. T1-bin1]|nr:pentapeptide repeat-containing protein [Microcoleus sp. T1-bin1]